MRLRLPRLRRRGGTMPPHRPGRDTQLAAVSPGCVECERCHQRRVGSGEPDPGTMGWLMGGHDCTPEET